MFQVEDMGGSTLRYTGISKALVIDNVDPDKRGRIKVKHPILGDEGIWIPYATDANSFSVPTIGDIVYLECDAGSIMHPVARGTLVKDGGGAVPDVFLRNEPTNRGMWSKYLLFEMDDGKGPTADGRGIRFSTASKLKFSILDTSSETGFILDDNGMGISILGGVTDSITLKVNFGDTLSISKSDGIQASTPTGTTLSMKSGESLLAANDTSISLKADAFVIKDAAGNKIDSSTTGINVSDVAGAGLIVKSGKVALKGTAGELLAIIEELLDALTQATYPGYGAPASNVAQYPLIKAKITAIKAT